MASKLEAFAAGLAALRLEGDRFLALQADGKPIAVAVADVLAFDVAEDGVVTVLLADGRRYGMRPGKALADIERRLAAHPGFVRVQNTRLLNLEYVATIRRARKGHALGLADGTRTAMTMGQEQVIAYLGLDDLDHVLPWNDRLAAIVKEKLRTFEKDIRFMDDGEIRGHFSTASTGELVLRQLVGNIVWQAYNWIQEGKIDPLDGNIRSFWYSHIKVVLGRFVNAKNSHYKMLSNVFTEFVGDHHLFRYADFGLVDDSGSSWKIGPTAPQIILCAEKQGHWKALQQLGRETGVTVIALGGQPSMLTTEGLVDELVRAGVDLDQRFHLVTDVDYDPSGSIIANSFGEQLHKMGVKGEVTRLDLILPANFTAEEIRVFRYPVADEDDSNAKKTRDWMTQGGGLPGPDGKMVADGLESDTMPRSRLRELATAAIEELKKAPPEEAWKTTQVRVERERPAIHDIWGAPLPDAPPRPR